VAGPLIIAHRGASAVEHENSLAAFRAAFRLGADGVELDIHDTADGALVVHHDPSIGQRIGSLTLVAVQAHHLPNGETIATLPEVLAAIGSGRLVFIEIKSLAPDHDAALFAALDAGPSPATYHVHGFDHRIIQRLTAARQGLLAGVLSSSYPVNPLQQLEDAGATELWQSAATVDVALTNLIHGEGCHLFAWTVNDPEEARALDQLGVDAVCTDQPGLLRAALAR
jgi:glycerophosphoryl diester phosphodiesterase